MNRVVSILILVLVTGTACARGEAAPTLSHGEASPEALASTVLKALENGDSSVMRHLRVTREEYEAWMWNELPESRTFPIDYVWMLNDRRSTAALTEAVREFRGTRFELVDLTFGEPSETYPGFTLHLGARLRVRRASDGRVGNLPLLDVLVERNGRWKVLNYTE